MKTIVTLGLFAVLVLTQGCATTGGYGQFYQSETTEQFPPSQNIRVYRYTEDGLRALRNEGYSVIGQSNFNGPLADQRQAIAQGTRVGADVVLVDYRFSGTVQGALPMTQYHDPQTTTIRSYGTASGSAYGSGGYAYGNAVGQSTTYVTSPGYTTTQYIPYSVQRYDHVAIYLHKIRPPSTTQQPRSANAPGADIPMYLRNPSAEHNPFQ